MGEEAETERLNLGVDGFFVHAIGWIGPRFRPNRGRENGMKRDGETVSACPAL